MLLTDILLSAILALLLLALVLIAALDTRLRSIEREVNLITLELEIDTTEDDEADIQRQLDKIARHRATGY